MAKRRQSVSIQEEDAFKMVIDELMEEVVWHPPHQDIDDAHDWLLKMVDYNVPHGKQIRGRGVISAYKSFMGTPQKKSMKAIYILGWCVELFGACFYIPEDVMRRSITRRGQICWYLTENVGKTAVNDSYLLKGVIFFILDHHFKDKPCHKFLVQLFHKAFFNTSMGQNLDSRMGADRNFHEFSMTNYYRVSKYKVGYFSFYLPIAVAKIMVLYDLADDGNPDQKEMAMIEDIAIDMGHLFQVQDDYLDCFGNPKITGRNGTTIQCNRCSWFIVKALQKVDCYQEKALKESYGKMGMDNVQRVVKIFQDLGLLEEYKRYEVECYDKIMAKISKLPETIPALFFSETLDIIIKRDR